MAETQQNPQHSLSTIGVLKESFKTTRRNGKLAASILLLVLCSSFPVELGTKLLKILIKDQSVPSTQWVNPSSYSYMGGSTPMDAARGIRSSQQANPGSYGSMDQFTPGDETKFTQSAQQVNPGLYSYPDQFMPIGELKAIRPILMLELSTLAAFWVILLFFFISTVSSSYEAHTTKVMNLRDVFLKVRESWKRPIHTSLSLTLISFGLFVLLSLFVALIQIFADGSAVYILYAILAVSGFLTYLYMAARWILSLVVSVLESDSSGLKAIDRAGELMKGKQIQAFIFMILFHLAMGAVHMASDAMTKKHDGWVKMAITIPFTLGLISILKLLMFAVYTVYYHDRKMNQKEEGWVKELGLYIPIASDEP